MKSGDGWRDMVPRGGYMEQSMGGDRGARGGGYIYNESGEAS